MATTRAPVVIAAPPRLFRAAEAAAYLGISETTLRGLGLPRRKLGTIPLFDRLDLDAFASDLPREGDGESAGGGNSCDDAFGITR